MPPAQPSTTLGGLTVPSATGFGLKMVGVRISAPTGVVKALPSAQAIEVITPQSLTRPKPS